MSGRSISIYSSPFYTSRHGYKMCGRVYPNGDGMGKNSHLSLFFVVMRGEYDALLSWPFRQRVTFSLINLNGGEHVSDSFRPDPNSTSFKRPTTNMNIASGCPLFLRLDLLLDPSNGYLKDDTLFIKISVDTADIREPLSHPDDKIRSDQWFDLSCSTFSWFNLGFQVDVWWMIFVINGSKNKQRVFVSK